MGQPPRGPARVAGGLAGVVGGEAWRGPRGGFEEGGPVTRAMLALGYSIASPGEISAVDVARKHVGVPGPAWLLPLAVVIPDRVRLADNATVLAGISEAPANVIDATVAWVTLAHQVVRASSSADVSMHQAPRGEAIPQLWGIAAHDAVTVSMWALNQPHRVFGDLAFQIADLCTPWVAAAAIGVLGLRDGCGVFPATWFRSVPAVGGCQDLSQELLLDRHGWGTSG